MSIDCIAEEERGKGRSHSFQARWSLVCLEVHGKRSQVASRGENVHGMGVGSTDHSKEKDSKSERSGSGVACTVVAAGRLILCHHNISSFLHRLTRIFASRNCYLSQSSMASRQT